jgi:hypothetical protein
LSENLDYLTDLRINLQQISSSHYNSGSRTAQAAITVIAACSAPLPHTFVADSTLTDLSTTKCLLTLKTRLRFIKSEGPLNLKKISIGTMASHKLLIDTTFDPC